MANLPDVSNVDPNAGSFPVLPKGQYPVHIYDSEKKVTSKGDGEYLRLYIEVIQGPHAGEKLSFCDLNLWNNNDQAVQIAQRQLAQICHATNTVGARDSAQFHHKAMLAEIDIQPAEGQYRERNRYLRFLPINGAQPAAAAPQTRAAAQSAPAAAPGNAPPWRRAAPPSGE